MTSWLKRTQAGIQSAATTARPVSTRVYTPKPAHAGRLRDPNAPDVRLDIESSCIYERRLPGNAYITAHVTRLQDGFYDSPSTHGDTIENVRFLALQLVFHPSETINRFQSATVTIGLRDDTNQNFSDPVTASHRMSMPPPPVPRRKPKFLRFAPHVLFGAVSPETLDWNFNLIGSLGVNQGSGTASRSPSGGIEGSYKLYQMMRIQGSTRTLMGDRHEYDIEDGEVHWTMEENAFQKSGLPREMTFVMLITKGDVENVVFDINIESKVASWFGHYPKWWNNMMKYQPLQKEHVDVDKEMGQRFEPAVPGRGFNFAGLAGTFNDFVSLPGTTYSLTDQAFADRGDVTDPKATTHAVQPQMQAPERANVGGRMTMPSQASQPAAPVQDPATAPARVPAPQPTGSPDVPMDYHIYLHNPRSINLHATPSPAPPMPGLPQALAVSHTSSDLKDIPQAISRLHSTAPQRVSSPSSANTKMKRRSIDISNVGLGLRSSGPQVPQQQLRNSSGGSLRRSHSRTDLRSSPLHEKTETSSSSETTRSALSSPLSVPTPPRNIGKENIAPEVLLPRSLGLDDMIIPTEAPSSLDSKNFLSPLNINGSFYHDPTSVNTQPRSRLPFELNTDSRSTGPGSNSPHTRTQGAITAIRPVTSYERKRSDEDTRKLDDSRRARTRDSPSPLRTRREVTPSPGEVDVNPMDRTTFVPNSRSSNDSEVIDGPLSSPLTSEPEPIPFPSSCPPGVPFSNPNNIRHNPLKSHPPNPTPKPSDLPHVIPASTPPASAPASTPQRRVLSTQDSNRIREISPYGMNPELNPYLNPSASHLSNGDVEAGLPFNEAKGDLRAMAERKRRQNARKRFSMPAHYEYIMQNGGTGGGGGGSRKEEDEDEASRRARAALREADGEWDER